MSAAEVSPQTLYVLVDGVQAHRSDVWHKAQGVNCSWDDADGHRQCRCAVRFESAAEFMPFVWLQACRCGLGQAQRLVLAGDAADWIWRHIGGLLKNATWIVDWYQALKHVWACGRALHGGDERVSEGDRGVVVGGPGARHSGAAAGLVIAGAYEGQAVGAQGADDVW